MTDDLKETAGCLTLNEGRDIDPIDGLLGKRIALPGCDNETIASVLVGHGATICDAKKQRIDLLVTDVTSVSADFLKASLSEQNLIRLRQGDIQIVSRRQLFETLNCEINATVHGLVTRAMLAEMLKVSVARLRTWQRCALIQPVQQVNKLDYFDFQQVAAAKQVAALVELGLTPTQIQKSLNQISAWSPERPNSLGELSIIIDGPDILIRQGTDLIDTRGQFRLKFVESTDETARTTEENHILPFRDPATINSDSQSPGSEREFLSLASELEEAGDLDAAIDTYRSMQMAFGPSATGCLEMAELLFRQGELLAARERYSMAIEIDESLVEARSALGLVFAELEQTDLAIAALRGALQHHPDYADVHFQLARILQSTGDDRGALDHWQHFVRLVPAGPWTDEAFCQIEALKLKNLQAVE